MTLACSLNTPFSPCSHKSSFDPPSRLFHLESIMSSSRYSTLEKATHQIRLLEVLPRSPLKCDALVDCALAVVSLDEAPSYIAPWGDERNKRPVLVDGSEMGVTRNLEEALRHLQQEHKSFLVWADAVCINQGNCAEKDHQIQLMRNIYETASVVFI